MIKCSNCGNEIKEGAKFCSKCGNNILEQQEKSSAEILSEEKDHIKKCANCGNEIREGIKFCSKCGNRVLEQQKENDTDFLSEKEEEIKEKNKKIFNFKKVKMIGRLRYKIILTEARSNGEHLEIKQNVHRFFRKDKENHLEIKLSEISSMELKTKMDFWDMLYAVIFGVMFLMDVTNLAWLLLIAIFLYTGYGKILNLKMKNGLKFEIPVNGVTEDVEQFQALIGLKE